MSLINENHETLTEDFRQFWEDTLKNKKALHFEYEKAIYALLHEQKKSYSIDTGQNSINVTRQDVSALKRDLQKLEEEIEYLEEKMGIVKPAPAMVQGVPKW